MNGGQDMRFGHKYCISNSSFYLAQKPTQSTRALMPSTPLIFCPSIHRGSYNWINLDDCLILVSEHILSYPSQVKTFRVPSMQVIGQNAPKSVNTALILGFAFYQLEHFMCSSMITEWFCFFLDSSGSQSNPIWSDALWNCLCSTGERHSLSARPAPGNTKASLILQNQSLFYQLYANISHRI